MGPGLPMFWVLQQLRLKGCYVMFTMDYSPPEGILTPPHSPPEGILTQMFLFLPLLSASLPVFVHTCFVFS